MPDQATQIATQSARLQLAQTRQAVTKEIADLAKTGRSFGQPSKFKYIILFTLAVIVDIVDLADLTGFGLIIARIFAFLCSVIMFLIFWFSNTKQTNASNFAQDLDGIVASIQKNIDHINRLAVKYTRLARKIPALRKSAVRVYKIAKKNPIGKFVGAAVINLIPFLAVLPWQTIGVYLSYRDEKATYRIAQEEAEKAAFALQGQLQTQLPNDINEIDLDEDSDGDEALAA